MLALFAFRAPRNKNRLRCAGRLQITIIDGYLRPYLPINSGSAIPASAVAAEPAILRPCIEWRSGVKAEILFFDDL